MTTRITLAELTEHLPDIIERVHDQGESVVVERNGAPLVTISPPAAGPARSFEELADRFADVKWPDNEFADDLEAIQAEMNRLPAQVPEWPS
jgi:antitoxin (DNA-binding transcriptional repressor) of toxin-antitoxin stability system